MRFDIKMKQSSLQQISLVENSPTMTNLPTNTFKKHVLLCFFICLNFFLHAQADKESLNFTFPIAEVLSTDAEQVKVQLNFGLKDGLFEKSSGRAFGLYDKDNPSRNVDLGGAIVIEVSENSSTLQVTLRQNAELFKGDLVKMQVQIARKQPRTDIFNLVKHDIFLSDAKNQPLYSRAEILANDGDDKASRVISKAQDEAQDMAKFNKARFDSLKINYGKYKGLTLWQALQNIRPRDVRSFIRYLDAAPNRYMGRKLDVGLELASWIYEGATMSYFDLAEIFLSAKSPVEIDQFQKVYQDYITKDVLTYWGKLTNYYYRNKEIDRAFKLNELSIRFYKIIGTEEEVALEYFFQAELHRAQKKLDTAIKANKNALSWFQKTGNKLQVFQTMQQKGQIYEECGKPEESTQAYEEAITYGGSNTDNSSGFTKALLEMLQKQAEYAETQKDYKKYISYQQQKLKFQSPADKEDYALTLAYLGFANNIIGNQDEAVDYYLQSIHNYDTTQMKHKYSATTIFKNIGAIYHNKKEYDSALYYYKPAAELSMTIMTAYPSEQTMVMFADVAEQAANSIFEKGETQKALESYQNLYEFRKNIAQNYPTEENDRQVSVALSKVGQANAKLGNGEDALKFFEERITVNKKSGNKEGEADAYWAMAESLSDNMREYDKAIEYYQKALVIFTELGKVRQQGRLYQNIGLNYYRKGEYQEALKFHQKNLAIKQQLLDENPSKEFKNNLAWAYDHLADTYLKLDETDKAQDFYEKRIKLHEVNGSASELGDAFWDIGILWSDYKNDPTKAIEYFEKAIATAKSTGDEKAQGSLYRNVALNYDRQKDYQNALKNYKASYTVRKKLADELQDSVSQSNLAQTLDGLSDIHMHLGDYETALKWQQERIPIYEHFDNQESVADTYWDLGIIYGDKIKDYQKAVDYYNKSIHIYEELDDKKNLATLYNNISINYSSLNQFEKALEYNNKALTLHQELHQGDTSVEFQHEIADDLKDIGYRYYQKEEFEKAEEKFKESISLFKQTIAKSDDKDIQKGLGAVLGKLSDNYLAQGLYGKALTTEEERLKIYQKSEDKANSADAYFNQGYITNLESKDFEKSIDYYEKAVVNYLAAKDTGTAVIAISNIGQNHWRLLNYKEAIDSHLRAIELANRIGDNERIGSSYSYLADLYKQTGEPQKSLDAYNKSIEALHKVNDKAELLEAFSDLGDLYAGNKDHQKAIEYYEKALELARLANDRKKEGNMLFNLANVYHGRNDSKNAQYFYEKSLALRREINDKKGQSYSLANLGLLRVSKDDYGKAEQYYQEAIDIAKQMNDKNIESYGKRGMANLLIQQGKYGDAEQIYLSVLEYYTETKDYHEQVNTVLRIANLYTMKGDFDKALEMNEEAHLIAKKSAYKTGIAAANTDKASIFRLLGDFEHAWEAQEQSLNLFIEDENPWGVASVYTGMGNIKNSQGRYNEAIVYYQKADSAYQKLGSEYNRSIPINNIGNIHYWQGDYKKALKYFQESAAILDKLGVKDAFRAMVDGNIAEIYYKLKRYDEAERLVLKSLEEGRKFDDKGLIASNLEIIGRAKIEQKEFDEAEEYLDEAYKIVKSMKSKGSVAWVASSLGRLYYQTQDFEDAQKYLDESLKISDEIGSNKYKWEVLYHKGLIAHQKKQLEEGKKYLIEAVSVLEDLMSKVSGGDEARKKFAAGDEKIKLYDALIGLLIEKGEIELAQKFLDHSNNEDLRREFKQLNIKFNDESANKALKTEKELKAKVDNLENELAKEKGKSNANISTEKIKKLEVTKGIAEEKYIKFVNETFRSNPNLSQHFSKSVNPIELKTDKNKHLIPKDVAMVSYLPGTDKLYIFAATSDTVVARVVNVKREDIIKKITFMHSFGTHHIGGPNTDKLNFLDKNPVTKNKEFDANSSQFKTISEELYNLLISPVEQEMSSRTKVGIVPSGMLHFLPFQMLGKVDKAGKFNFLVEKQTIFYANSLKMLERFVGKKEELKVLAFGNADKSLPATEKEVNDIKDLYPNSKIYIREEATENLVKKASDQFNVLHFATHGNLDYYNFHQSYLTLAEDAANGEDGKLTIEEVWEIESLYNYKLVTLSACQTAVSEKKGSWPVSPATSFIDAGANTVVASLWSVDDKATALLMKYFYQNLETMEKVEALRHAQVMLGQQENYKHPYYWAPFVLIGDWR